MFSWIQLWWDTWDLRAVILLSLFLQTFLFFSAPLRKRTANSLVTIPIWLAYNLADVSAIFGVGLISKSCGDALGPYANPELVAFWAPFLLLHLGGPDTITAFALQDNELWLRHLLQLVVQLATSAYVFILTLSSNNQLWLPTLLMFISALIKSTERSRSLYLASWHRFRDSMIKEPDPGKSCHKLMDAYCPNQESGLPSRQEISEPPNPEPIVGDKNEPMLPNFKYNDGFYTDVLEAIYHHFEIVKGLIADLKFSSRERDKSRSHFLKLTPEHAFLSVETELNFLYDILFTKTPVISCYSRFNPSRFVSSVSCLAAFVLFHLMDPKHKFLHHKIDVEITYTLLIGTIIHDVIAFFVICTSNWNTVFVKPLDPSYYNIPPIDNIGVLIIWVFFPVLYRICFIIGIAIRDKIFHFIPIMNRRWSGCISQYNLIFYCLHPRSKKWDKLIGKLGLTNILDGKKYVVTKRFNEQLRDFIFEELKIKSEKAVAIKTSMEICSAKGDWVLTREDGCNNLLPYTLHADYDKILILWHIATELCYITEEGNSENEQEISKVLSDYMLYLLIMEPSMMSAVAGTAQIRFRDTCATAKLFFRAWEARKKAEDGHKVDMIQACRIILEFDILMVFNPPTVKEDTSKTVFFDAWILAKELKKLDKDKWKILSKVWVELLSYAACRCNANSHATQLSKGGQLISSVWLLMVHLGLGDQFEVSEDHQTDPQSRDENHQQPDQRDDDLV
ncbi:hypothetical protein Vadar_016681 [Vaccinium darrowii]|uniref:Uncharacterized protein n=1 Tax=Vaccinium darrowii TaxID=229202 RepID=A0ACB7YW49_9ERIC|nr:hypothetical protein Vadar_016681 [Vaccinium darrowii]